MANEDEQIEGAEDGSGKKKGGKGLLITLVLVLLLGGGGAAAWFMFGGSGPAKAEAKPLPPPRYVSVDPPFVVNFESESVVRFLQVAIGIMTRDPAVETLIKDNDPRVRNDLLMILSNQTYDTVASAAGKEALRTRCLESVRAIVAEMKGDPKKVEALYFTSFVMQ
jgi:flagellar FliL protein